MSGPQAAAWHGLMDLHCADRDYGPPRPTEDIDTVLDVRAQPDMLLTFTGVLVDLGFQAGGTSAEGLQHRWVRDEAQIDVLLPDGVGERAAVRTGAGGAPTLPKPGGTQVLARSESVAVTVEGRAGFVRCPNLVGAVVMKAAAHMAVCDAARGRHRRCTRAGRRGRGRGAVPVPRRSALLRRQLAVLVRPGRHLPLAMAIPSRSCGRPQLGGYDASAVAAPALCGKPSSTKSS